jgi:hypothetical protein
VGARSVGQARVWDEAGRFTIIMLVLLWVIPLRSPEAMLARLILV